MILAFYLIFPADVWGTVSDWVMVLVTAGTGYVVWQTLKSQTKVQQLQEKTTRIELSRHIKEIRPAFTLLPINFQQWNQSKRGSMLWVDLGGVSFKFQLNENIAENINLTQVTARPAYWTGLEESTNCHYLNAKDYILAVASYSGYQNGTPSIHQHDTAITFRLEYSDIYKNRYIQICEAAFIRNSFQIVNHEPRLVGLSDEL